MASSVKNLPCKHKDLHLISRIQAKCQARWRAVITPGLGRRQVDPGGSLNIHPRILGKFQGKSGSVSKNGCVSSKNDTFALYIYTAGRYTYLTALPHNTPVGMVVIYDA